MTNNPNEIESQIVEGRRRIAAAQVAIAKILGMVKRQVRETVAMRVLPLMTLALM
jgi:hypothetical protein